MGLDTNELGHVPLKGLDVVVDVLDRLGTLCVVDELANFFIFDLKMSKQKGFTLGTETSISVSNLYSAL